MNSQLILSLILVLLVYCTSMVLLFEEEQGETVEIKKNYVLNDGDVQELTDVHGNYDLIEEDNVIVLTRQNFNHVVHTREYVLVEFYAPWCTHCKSLAPEYAAAAGDMKDSELSVSLGKVDATVEIDLAKEYGITGFPTIFLFHKGLKVEDYNGERTAQGILNYLAIRTDPSWTPPPTDVVELNSKNFKKYLAKKPLVLVLFYAEYCQHCLKIKPEYINAAEVLKGYGVPLAQLEGTNGTNKEIADEFKVKGWPTLFVFRFGRAFEYKGGRESKDIISYMKEQLQSPTIECKNLKELENRYDRYIPTIVGLFTSAKSSFYEEFFTVANYLRAEPLRFIHSFSKEVRASYKIENEAVIVKKAGVFVSDYESADAILDDVTKSGDEIAEFIRVNYRPLVGHRTKNNQALVYSKRPLVLVYYDANFNHEHEKESQRIRAKVVEVAKDFPNVYFAVANEDDYADELEAVKLGDSGVDVNVVWYGEHRLKYRMDPVDDFDGSDLRNFVNRALEDKLTPVWKSQPIPKRQEGPVFMAVADNFEAEVYKPSGRSVVFYIYAPWCGHCKEFEKTFKKLAKKLGSDTLFFAKMDGTLNDLPPGFEVKGYPTVFFIGADKKHEPVLYDGDRSFAHVKSFINRQLKLSKDEL